jgi:hypothetical protein
LEAVFPIWLLESETVETQPRLLEMAPCDTTAVCLVVVSGSPGIIHGASRKAPLVARHRPVLRISHNCYPDDNHPSKICTDSPDDFYLLAFELRCRDMARVVITKNTLIEGKTSAGRPTKTTMKSVPTWPHVIKSIYSGC